MFRIEDGREQFYQWDTERRLIVKDSSITQVHYCNKTDDCSLVTEVYEENGTYYSNVPNILLQSDWAIRVYAYDKFYTKHCETFKVNARSKPADYAYTETEVMNWETMHSKVDALVAEVEEAEQIRQDNELTRCDNEIARTDAEEEREENTFIAITAANQATERANQAAERADNAIDAIPNTFANALKGSKSGEAIGIKDISPIEHNMGVSVRGKNLIPFPYESKTQTKNGVTFTVNDDGTINVNGIATANTTFILKQNILLKKGSTYTVSGCPSGGSTSTYCLYIQDMGYHPGVAETGNGRKITTDYEKYYMWITINNGTTINNLVFKPQLEEGTTATSYAPYIEDISTVKLYKQGKNWLSVGLVRGNFTPTTTDANNLSNQASVISSYGFYLKAGTYVVSGIGNTYNLFINGMITTTKTSDYQVYRGSSRKITIPTDGLYNLQFNKITNAEVLDIETLKVQVEIGETATQYEPYIEPVIYDVSTDGIVEGVNSIYPSTTLYTDTPGAIIDTEYNRDINKAFAELQNALISLGGNV